MWNACRNCVNIIQPALYLTGLLAHFTPVHEPRASLLPISYHSMSAQGKSCPEISPRLRLDINLPMIRSAPPIPHFSVSPSVLRKFFGFLAPARNPSPCTYNQGCESEEELSLHLAWSLVALTDLRVRPEEATFSCWRPTYNICL